MPEYNVVWTIQVDAESASKAAAAARKVQLRKDSTAVVFDVGEHDGTYRTMPQPYDTIDLNNEEELLHTD